MKLSFDDVLIQPQFSTIASRKDVNTTVSIAGEFLNKGVIASNMSSVTGSKMSQVMLSCGAQSCLPRFQSIDDNVKLFSEGTLYPGKSPWVSIGLGVSELDRASALYESGAKVFVIDVAHGASIEVVKQTKALRQIIKDRALVVGNFATKESVKAFIYHLGDLVDAIKVGIGGGAACVTRIVTGCGAPTLASVIDCTSIGIPVIADGGIRNSGDIAKCFAAGASSVMLGRMLAGCDESPGVLVDSSQIAYKNIKEAYFGAELFKQYSGSASAESYDSQGKNAEHRTPEGVSMLVPYTGSVRDVIQQIDAGLRSAMSYVGASNLKEFKDNAKFIQVTNSGLIESKAHGKL